MEVTLVALALATGGAADAVCPMASRRFWQIRLARLCARRRTLVLTYDDGPSPLAMPGILDALGSHGARATFFALGRQAERNPALLDRAIDEGHEIGCHTFDHGHPWKTSPWAAAGDVSRGFRALAPWIRRPALFRPAYGKLTSSTWAAARACGGRIAWWTLDSGDSWAVPREPLEVAEAVRIAGGGVVLMHDFHDDPARAEHVQALTGRLVGVARDAGMRVTPLGRLLDERAGA